MRDALRIIEKEVSMNKVLSFLRSKYHQLKNGQPRRRDDQNHMMTDDEKVDQAVFESYPASDPPGYMPSKTMEDKINHPKL